MHHRLTPAINLTELDDQIALDVARTRRELPDGPLAAMGNSFGLGAARM